MNHQDDLEIATSQLRITEGEIDLTGNPLTRLTEIKILRKPQITEEIIDMREMRGILL